MFAGSRSVRGRERTPVHRVWRLAVLMVGAMIASVVAIRSFPPPPKPICPASAPGNPTYLASLEPGARVGVHDYGVSLFRQGRPIAGFQVCLNVVMDGMPDMQVTAQPLRFENPQQLRVNFEMAGTWTGAVMLIRHNHPIVAVPIHFAVT